MARSERLADLGRLAAGLAHELRNPLASMMGAQELLAQAPGLDGENRRLMEIALRESSRLAQLVTQFLQFARPRPAAARPVRPLDAGRRDPRRLRERPGRREGGAGAGARPGEHRGDPDQLRQVLWNLLLNAAQAAGDRERSGPGHVRVACGEDRGGAFLVVDDDGPGVADRPSGSASSSPSSPPSRSARGSASPTCTASSTRTAAPSRWGRRRPAARAFTSGSRASHRRAGAR